jgi:hypothetical protein
MRGCSNARKAALWECRGAILALFTSRKYINDDAAGAVVGVAEENTGVWNNSTTLASPTSPQVQSYGFFCTKLGFSPGPHSCRVRYGHHTSDSAMAVLLARDEVKARLRKGSGLCFVMRIRNPACPMNRGAADVPFQSIAPLDTQFTYSLREIHRTGMFPG